MSLTGIGWMLDFQYPLSDRTHCNCGEREVGELLTETFSILYRIELTVTLQRRLLAHRHDQLSVSSIGSNSL